MAVSLAIIIVVSHFVGRRGWRALTLAAHEEPEGQLGQCHLGEYHKRCTRDAASSALSLLDAQLMTADGNEVARELVILVGVEGYAIGCCTGATGGKDPG